MILFTTKKFLISLTPGYQKKPSWLTAPKKPTNVDLKEGDMINCLLPLQDP